MKNRIIQCTPTVLILFIIGFSYFSQWCTEVGKICHGTLVDQMIPEVTYPLYFFGIYILPIAIILIFISRRIFKSWLKLAAWAIPLSIFYIAMIPVNWTGIGLDLFPFYRDDAARVAGIFFSVVSLILIAWKYFALYRRRHTLKKTDQTTFNH